MAELILDTNQRLVKLYEFACGLADGLDGKILFQHYRDYTGNITAEETMKVIDHLLVTGYPAGKVKETVGKLINVFHSSLKSREWEHPGEGHFLYYLMLENREVEKVMAEIRRTIKAVFSDNTKDGTGHYQLLLDQLNMLKDFDLHYIKKENILFPYIEKTFPQYRCLQIMWSFHDDFRRSLKNLEDIVRQKAGRQILNKELGKLFFTVFPLIFREEKIVFPVALGAIPENEWAEMLDQSKAVGWCYNVKPQYVSGELIPGIQSSLIDLGTGCLDSNQISMILNNLPVDITYVDENDEVRYFSGTHHRIFPRSKAIIGRKVQNCHPSESVHIVNRILEAFKKGTQDHADFRVSVKDRFIHIRYFALRDEMNEYRGTIEVSQDVTEIRKIKGEKRLLDWNI